MLFKITEEGKRHLSKIYEIIKTKKIFSKREMKGIVCFDWAKYIIDLEHQYTYWDRHEKKSKRFSSCYFCECIFPRINYGIGVHITICPYEEYTNKYILGIIKRIINN